ncbi:MAG: putative anti-sigma factor antagonist BtrV [Chlamydiae bacterium]|nr:putative anti-sigma factor antagonist BtrV [Chlamydiota bacterium]
MHIEEEKKKDYVIIKVSGRLDAINSPRFEKKMKEKLDEEKRKILLDFLDVEYLSSSGMRVLLSFTKKLDALGGKLVVFNVDEDVLEVLKMAGFDRVIKIVSSQQKAEELMA